jgi:hypothetical protein
MRAIGAHEGGNFDLVDTGIPVRAGLGLGADGVDASVRPRSLAKPVIDVLLHEIQRLGTAVAGERQRLGHGVDGDDTPAPKRNTVRIAICPAGPQPQIAIVSSSSMLQKSAAMYPVG